MAAPTALGDRAAGDELTISYVDGRLPYAERRKILRDHYGFDCACGRCAAERKALLAKARHRAR